MPLLSPDKLIVVLLTAFVFSFLIIGSLAYSLEEERSMYHLSLQKFVIDYLILMDSAVLNILGIGQFIGPTNRDERDNIGNQSLILYQLYTRSVES